ncbi:hypothetical protein EYF80_061961 [Liparis tanakae]|uniref:Uncharacterized protein n=1 Tax=Liparis tanakae TaxID=230148 RepID=A0A4Z2EHR9_9TELE|nr:hypothetical protein EYF80_061961 [Liparis tanakae]
MATPWPRYDSLSEEESVVREHKKRRESVPTAHARWQLAERRRIVPASKAVSSPSAHVCTIKVLNHQQPAPSN